MRQRSHYTGLGVKSFSTLYSTQTAPRGNIWQHAATSEPRVKPRPDAISL